MTINLGLSHLIINSNSTNSNGNCDNCDFSNVQSSFNDLKNCIERCVENFKEKTTCKQPVFVVLGLPKNDDITKLTNTFRSVSSNGCIDSNRHISNKKCSCQCTCNSNSNAVKTSTQNCNCLKKDDQTHNSSHMSRKPPQPPTTSTSKSTKNHSENTNTNFNFYDSAEMINKLNYTNQSEEHQTEKREKYYEEQLSQKRSKSYNSNLASTFQTNSNKSEKKTTHLNQHEFTGLSKIETKPEPVFLADDKNYHHHHHHQSVNDSNKTVVNQKSSINSTNFTHFNQTKNDEIYKKLNEQNHLNNTNKINLNCRSKSATNDLMHEKIYSQIDRVLSTAAATTTNTKNRSSLKDYSEYKHTNSNANNNNTYQHYESLEKIYRTPSLDREKKLINTNNNHVKYYRINSNSNSQNCNTKPPIVPQTPPTIISSKSSTTTATNNNHKKNLITKIEDEYSLLKSSLSNHSSKIKSLPQSPASSDISQITIIKRDNTSNNSNKTNNSYFTSLINSYDKNEKKQETFKNSINTESHSDLADAELNSIKSTRTLNNHFDQKRQSQATNSGKNTSHSNNVIIDEKYYGKNHSSKLNESHNQRHIINTNKLNDETNLNYNLEVVNTSKTNRSKSLNSQKHYQQQQQQQHLIQKEINSINNNDVKKKSESFTNLNEKTNQKELKLNVVHTALNSSVDAKKNIYTQTSRCNSSLSNSHRLEAYCQTEPISKQEKIINTHSTSKITNTDNASHKSKNTLFINESDICHIQNRLVPIFLNDSNIQSLDSRFIPLYINEKDLNKIGKNPVNLFLKTSSVNSTIPVYIDEKDLSKIGINSVPVYINEKFLKQDNMTNINTQQYHFHNDNQQKKAEQSTKNQSNIKTNSHQDLQQHPAANKTSSSSLTKQVNNTNITNSENMVKRIMEQINKTSNDYYEHYQTSNNKIIKSCPQTPISHLIKHDKIEAKNASNFSDKSTYNTQANKSHHDRHIIATNESKIIKEEEEQQQKNQKSKLNEVDKNEVKIKSENYSEYNSSNYYDRTRHYESSNRDEMKSSTSSRIKSQPLSPFSDMSKTENSIIETNNSHSHKKLSHDNCSRISSRKLNDHQSNKQIVNEISNSKKVSQNKNEEEFEKNFHSKNDANTVERILMEKQKRQEQQQEEDNATTKTKKAAKIRSLPLIKEQILTVQCHLFSTFNSDIININSHLENSYSSAESASNSYKNISIDQHHDVQPKSPNFERSATTTKNLKNDESINEQLTQETMSFSNNNLNKTSRLIEDVKSKELEQNKNDGIISKQSFLSKTETELNRFSRNSNMSELVTTQNASFKTSDLSNDEEDNDHDDDDDDDREVRILNDENEFNSKLKTYETFKNLNDIKDLNDDHNKTYEFTDEMKTSLLFKESEKSNKYSSITNSSLQNTFDNTSDILIDETEPFFKEKVDVFDKEYVDDIKYFENVTKHDENQLDEEISVKELVTNEKTSNCINVADDDDDDDNNKNDQLKKPVEIKIDFKSSKLNFDRNKLEEVKQKFSSNSKIINQYLNNFVLRHEEHVDETKTNQAVEQKEISSITSKKWITIPVNIVKSTSTNLNTLNKVEIPVKYDEDRKLNKQINKSNSNEAVFLSESTFVLDNEEDFSLSSINSSSNNNNNNSSSSSSSSSFTKISRDANEKNNRNINNNKNIRIRKAESTSISTSNEKMFNVKLLEEFQQEQGNLIRQHYRHHQSKINGNFL